MSIGRRLLARVACLAIAGSLTFAGCSGGTDAGVRAVQDARSAVVVARNATRLLVDGRATGPYTQVVLSDTLDAVGDAEQQLREASGIEPGRLGRARGVLQAAEAVIDELDDAGADRLGESELHRLDDLVGQLDAALKELRR